MKKYVPLFEDFEHEFPDAGPTHKPLFPESDKPFRQVALDLIEENLEKIAKDTYEDINYGDGKFNFYLDYTDPRDKPYRFNYDGIWRWEDIYMKSITVYELDGPKHIEVMRWTDKVILEDAITYMKKIRELER